MCLPKYWSYFIVLCQKNKYLYNNQRLIWNIFIVTDLQYISLQFFSQSVYHGKNGAL
jgi:hypothetical protein